MPRQDLNKLINDNKQQILNWIEERKTITFMAKELQCDRGSFREALKRNNIIYTGQQGGPDYSIQGKQFGNLIVIEPIEKENLSSNQIQVRGQYWLCKCVNCGGETILRTSVLKSGATFGDGCQRSKGELKIKEILNNANIQFQTEYKFEQCKIKTFPAKFDFAIFQDNQLEYLIEYDGKQHFEDSFSSWIKTKENLSDRQQSDKIKNNFCKENNIPLIRIPYTHYNDLCIQDLQLQTSKFIIN